MKKMDAKQITLAALAIAVVCVSTMVIQIPIPLGYMHLGNCCILLFGVFFSRAIGTLAGGVGSCLADLLSGYPQWILPTLIIKGIMGYAIAALSKAQVPGLTMEGVLGMVLFYAAGFAFEAAKLPRLFQKNA